MKKLVLISGIIFGLPGAMLKAGDGVFLTDSKTISQMILC